MPRSSTVAGESPSVDFLRIPRYIFPAVPTGNDGLKYAGFCGSSVCMSWNDRLNSEQEGRYFLCSRHTNTARTAVTMAATTLAQIGMGMSLTVTFACDTTRNICAIDMSIRKAAVIAVAGFMGSASISVHSRFEQLYKRGGMPFSLRHFLQECESTIPCGSFPGWYARLVADSFMKGLPCRIRGNWRPWIFQFRTFMNDASIGVVKYHGTYLLHFQLAINLE